jgi:subtilisin family serine protease
MSACASDGFAGGRVLYVHGTGDQPRPSELKLHWDLALFGDELGERSRMAYWAIRDAGPGPQTNKYLEGKSASLPAGYPNPDDRPLSREIVEQILADFAIPPADHLRLASVVEELLAAATARHVQTGERRALPSTVLRFLRELGGFLFDPAERRRLRDAVTVRLQSNTPLIVVAHELGALSAYDALLCGGNQPYDIRLFVTLGAPFGFRTLVSLLEQLTGQRLHKPACVRSWLNVAGVPDPLAGRVPLPAVQVHNVDHCGDCWEPLTIESYLSNAEVREHIERIVSSDFSQATGGFLIAKDVVRDLEDAPDRRHHVLLQLGDVDPQGNLEANRIKLLQTLDEVLAVPRAEANVEVLKRFVAAEMTRDEIEQISRIYRGLPISRIWKDAEKTSFVWRSTHTLKAHTANISYQASGRGVCWAVLDTGICGSHPHFQTYGNIAGVWDCTVPLVDNVPVSVPPTAATDVNGHGTHVAAIIAGCALEPFRVDVGGSSSAVKLAGMAPECRIRSYKVLDDRGRGRDSWIIKALDHIAEVNSQAGRLVVHGLNLSLGGPFDPTVYGCGHSPVCQELRRLWRQGVLICIAAGNDGVAEFQTRRGFIRANRDLTVLDPANLEQSIVVGSVHATNPHTYGVSYFSSRGPTADGRVKPDVVAPGEGILSANARADRRGEPLYTERTGTSVAAPHVSGILAAFLSLRAEFVGYPDRVKQLLLETCTSLDRDPHIQGRGLPNLVKMLLET